MSFLDSNHIATGPISEKNISDSKKSQNRTMKIGSSVEKLSVNKHRLKKKRKKKDTNELYYYLLIALLYPPSLWMSVKNKFIFFLYI